MTTKLRSVAEVKREADVLFDGIELANAWWVRTLTTDRAHIAAVLIAGLRGERRCQHEWSSKSYNCQICGAEEDWTRGDEDFNQALDTAIALIRTTLDVTSEEK